MLPQAKGAARCVEPTSNRDRCSVTSRLRSACQPTTPCGRSAASPIARSSGYRRASGRCMCSSGRPSIPPEKLLRAQLLQMLYSIRSERLLMEEIDYSMLYRWFVGLNLERRGVGPDHLHQEPRPTAPRPTWPRVSGASGAQARQRGSCSDEHFTVDGTLLEAWASLKSFPPRDTPPPDGPGAGGSNPMVDFRGQRRTNVTRVSDHGSPMPGSIARATVAAQLAYGGHLLMENRSGLIVDAA